MGADTSSAASEADGAANQELAAPSISLPKGGGAIRGIGEKFSAHPVTGTGSMSVPIATSPGRSGFGPKLSLFYDSGSGNGPFGFGWSLSLPAITRKTDKGLPQYRDDEESDVFIISGAEDLVPEFEKDATGDLVLRDGKHVIHDKTQTVDEVTYTVRRYRPRVEGLFARIERWTRLDGDVHWRSISKDNLLTVYGKDTGSRIYDPDEPARVFSWLICETRDDKGNAVLYEYKPEDGTGVDLTLPHQRNRGDSGDPRRTANRYIKRIHYGNRQPLLTEEGERPQLLNADQVQDAAWMFEVVFDYDEHDPDAPKPDDAGNWAYRSDPFSNYRSGFEVRTTRLCQRVLMFHHFEAEDGVGNDCLVRSTDFNYSHEQDPTDAHNPVYTFLKVVTQTGYRRKASGYDSRRLPPVEFEYTLPVVQDTVEEVDAASLDNLPIGVDGASYQWIDLHGEGIPGILTEQADAWFYKRNLSPVAEQKVEFAPTQCVASKPNLTLAGGQAQFMDLAGDGQPDLVVLEGPMSGLFEHDGAEGWEPFRPFTSRLNRDMRDPNVKLVDLDGDGHADVLITEDEAFVWHASLAEEGFGPAQRVVQALDEEKGPRVVFADGTQSIYLADLSGDGLTDLARIRNGEVCYWPSLGFGRFGSKVTMDNAPQFDNPDQFDQRRIRLADIDGSGTTDIVYLHRDGVRLYFNQSGNGWSQHQQLTAFPNIDDVVSIVSTDLLGNGTACLVWSSPLPGEARRPMRYVNLMGGQKPHLLAKTVNNLGAETRVQYAPSTKFYLQDEREGTPWITYLPFPVHVVERVETYDHIGRNHFVTRYAYHHGYFDRVEREFRGFGMVEQWDTEEWAALSDSGTLATGDNDQEASHIPPVLTRSWFHTGAYLGRDHVSDFFAGLLDVADDGSYYREPGLDDDLARELLLDDTVLPDGLTVEEEREACRALRGSMLRQEVYALDGSDREAHPYVVTEQNFTIRTVQPKAANRHAVFFTHARETLGNHYEREPSDPRIAHTLTLDVDSYGNVLKQAVVGYGRRELIRVVDEDGRVSELSNPGLEELDAEDQARQTRTLVTYTENSVTNAFDEQNAYRTPLPCETRTYELTGYTPSGAAGRFQPADLIEDSDEGPIHRFDEEIAYETEAGGGVQRRLIEHVRTIYRPDDLGAADGDTDALLPLGSLQARALPGEAYKLAFTPGLLEHVYRRPLDLLQEGSAPPAEDLVSDPIDVLPVDLPGGMVADRGGYVSSKTLRDRGAFPGEDTDVHWSASDNDGHWWVPSGRVFFSPDGGDDAAAELAEGEAHFFSARCYRDPFGQKTKVAYDDYDLLVLETCDPLNNRVTAGERLEDHTLDFVSLDYRVLQPTLVMGPNRNRSAVAFDALGMVVGTAVMGKPEEADGDSLEDFEPDLDEAVLLAHLADPHAEPHDLLGRASTRLMYDLFAYHRTTGDDETQPAVVCALARETHDADLEQGQQTRIQHSFSYSDGFGREIQKKIPAEPGPVPARDADGEIVVGPDGQPEMTDEDADPRWVGSGWTMFNNKGKPVRQYEPFFSDTHGFEFGVRVGVSPVLCYDPVGRVVATLHPNHTWEKVTFDPWRQETWDASDTVLVADPRDDADVGDFFRRLPEDEVLPTWHAQRAAGDLGTEEQDAAEKAAVHAQTPAVVHLDTLGRPFLTVAHNVFKFSNKDAADPPTEEFYGTRVLLDLEGNEREVVDALGRVVMRYDYDMLSGRIHQASMEAGERFTLNDVTGNPVRAWDSRDHAFRTAYDELRRPIESYLTDGSDPEQLVGRTVYGESRTDPEASNVRGQVVEVCDQAGVVTTDEYDFKGNLLSSGRQLAIEYKSILDWSGDVPLEDETFTGRTRYDALNRPIQSVVPHSDQPGTGVNVIQPIYNEANLLEQVRAWLGQDAEPDGLIDPDAETADLHAVTDVDYDAKGQRTRISYGNGATTSYTYDPLTFRLTRLLTQRPAVSFPDDCPDLRPTGWPGCQIQDLNYAYDPVGNITYIRDDAQQTIFFRNKRVEPSNGYTYDALYRLIEATGREHLGQIGGAPTPHSWDDAGRVGLEHPGDGNAMGNYLERYIYDAVGNFLEMQHRGTDPAHSGWTRGYTYEEPSQLESGKVSNRLSATTVGNDSLAPGPYAYDAHGSMTEMPHLSMMQCDFRDQLRATSRQVVTEGTPETTWYVYDASGERVRKVSEMDADATESAPRTKERVYLGGFEIYREFEIDGNTVALERETLHVIDDTRRIALVETRTKGNDNSPGNLVRYQFENHIGSITIELDIDAQIVSSEEYTPYGSSSYQAMGGVTAVTKRYRYTGKERDEESGLSYQHMRFYSPTIARWTSSDPTGLSDYISLYVYTRNNPVMGTDPSGTTTLNDIPEPIRPEDDEGTVRRIGGEIYVRLEGERFEWKSDNANGQQEWTEVSAGAMTDFIRLSADNQTWKHFAIIVTAPLVFAAALEAAGVAGGIQFERFILEETFSEVTGVPVSLSDIRNASDALPGLMSKLDGIGVTVTTEANRIIRNRGELAEFLGGTISQSSELPLWEKADEMLMAGGNKYTELIDTLSHGVIPDADDARKGFNAINRKFKDLVEAETGLRPGDTEHLLNLATHPELAVDPNYLVSTAPFKVDGLDQHLVAHVIKSGGGNPPYKSALEGVAQIKGVSKRWWTEMHSTVLPRFLEGG